MQWITCPQRRMPHKVPIELITDHKLEYDWYRRLCGIITMDVQTHDANGNQFRTHYFICEKCTKCEYKIENNNVRKYADNVDAT